MNEPLLKMQGITKYIYNSPGRPIRNSDVKILDSVSFDLRAGEVHVLMGENGAGKSTLMKILGGIIPADQGTITLEGAAVSFASAREARGRGIAFIHQELNLCANLDVGHNIFLGREPTRGGVLHKKELYAKARALLSSLGFEIDPRSRWAGSRRRSSRSSRLPKRAPMSRRSSSWMSPRRAFRRTKSTGSFPL